MSLILNAIQPRGFELIRNRIAEILAEEIPNQSLLIADPSLNAKVWMERFVRFDHTELPSINVSLVQGEFNPSFLGKKTGEYQFDIDVYSKGKSTQENGGDTLSTILLHRITGIIDAILSNPVYKTLGFIPPFIGGTRIQNIKIADPQKNMDTESVVMSRLSFFVRCEEITELIQPSTLDSHQTQVKMSLTDKGYLWLSQ